MSAKTKIIVLKMKELIYTAVFVGLAVLLLLIGWAMFRGDNSGTDNGNDPHTHEDMALNTNANIDQYIPGIYTTSLPLGNQHLDVEIIVDTARIRNIRLLPLDESVAAMYPLMEPTMESLRNQVLTSQSTDHITYEDNSKYTAYVLLQAIQTALEKAIVK